MVHVTRYECLAPVQRLSLQPDSGLAFLPCIPDVQGVAFDSAVYTVCSSQTRTAAFLVVGASATGVLIAILRWSILVHRASGISLRYRSEISA